MVEEASRARRAAPQHVAAYLFEHAALKDLAEANKDVMERLAPLGVDFCCGGAHTLSEMSKIKGFSRQEAIRVLEAMLPENPVGPETLISDLAGSRQAEAVLSRYGAQRCAPLAALREEVCVFAKAHDVPLPKLIAELNLSSQPPPPRSAAAPSADPFAAAHYLPLTRLGAFFLLLGAGYGLLLAATLAQIAWPLYPFLFRFYDTLIFSHAFLMLVGFTLSFIAGIGFHALPRFLGAPLAYPHLTSPVLVLLAGSVLLRVSGLIWEVHWLNVGSALCLLALCSLFLLVLFSTMRRSKKKGEPHMAYFRSALIWLAGSAVLYFYHALTGRVGLHQGFVHLFFLGFVLLFVFGFAYRTHPAFLRLLPMPDKRSIQAALLLYNAGLAGVALSLRLPAAEIPGLAMVLLASYLFVLQMKALKVEGLAFARRRPPDDWMMRAAYAWLLLGLPVMAWAKAFSELSLLPVAFHMLTIGFLLQMIIGMAWRVLPVFSGKPLWGTAFFPALFWALNIGVVLRAGGHLLVFWGARAGYLSVGLSGLLHFSTILFFVSSLRYILLPPSSERAHRMATS